MQGEDISKKLATVKIIAIALIISVLIIMFLPLLLPYISNNNTQGTTSTTNPYASQILLGIALTTITLSFVIYKFILNTSILKTPLQQRTANDAIHAIQLATVVSYALRESAVICGLIIYLLYTDPIPALVLGFLVLAINVIYFPTKERVNTLLAVSAAIKH